MEFDEVLQQVKRYSTPFITITGGEPLAQKDSLPLMILLCDAGYQVSLETSGALDVSGVDPRVNLVIDIKTPGSGEVQKNLYGNLGYLRKTDQIKCVICDRGDYDWAKALVLERRLMDTCHVLFSPVADRLNPRDLANWILEDQLPVRFQLQLHKILWGDEKGR